MPNSTRRTILSSVFLAGLTIPPLPAQTPSIEVSSIKENLSGSSDSTIRPLEGGQFRATNVTVFQLVRAAFTVQDFQIAEAPGWFYTVRYDIVAKAGDNSTGNPQAILQALLKDRFHLAYRRETRDGRVLALTVAKNGHKLKRNDSACTAPTPELCGNMRAATGRIQAERVSMEQLAVRLTRSLSQPVIDKTDIPGTFDFALEWTPDGAAAGDSPSIFTAIQEHLGLRLESQRGPVDTFVVDRVEKPAAN